MRTAPNITVKKKRIGTNQSFIKLPSLGEIIKLDDEVFKVDGLKQKKEGNLHIAEFVLDTMDGCLRIKMEIISIKPFRN